MSATLRQIILNTKINHITGHVQFVYSKVGLREL